jgi:hypothetical protein
MDMPDKCDDVPNVAPDQCLQAGDLVVSDNSMSNGGRILGTLLWTFDNAPPYLAQSWPAECPKHSPIVVERNTIGP